MLPAAFITRAQDAHTAMLRKDLAQLDLELLELKLKLRTGAVCCVCVRACGPVCLPVCVLSVCGRLHCSWHP